MNELDELVEQWPRNWQRTVALLAVHKNFHDNGATQWEIEMVFAEDQVNVHGLMINERRRREWVAPQRAARHAQNLALAEAALVESQRRKQGPKTGKGPRQAPQVPRHPKALVMTPARPRRNTGPPPAPATPWGSCNATHWPTRRR